MLARRAHNVAQARVHGCDRKRAHLVHGVHLPKLRRQRRGAAALGHERALQLLRHPLEFIALQLEAVPRALGLIRATAGFVEALFQVLLRKREACLAQLHTQLFDHPRPPARACLDVLDREAQRLATRREIAWPGLHHKIAARRHRSPAIG